MVARTSTAYHCDGCDTFLANNKIPKDCEKVKVVIYQNEEWATDAFELKQLCKDCQEEVVEFVKRMRSRK